MRVLVGGGLAMAITALAGTAVAQEKPEPLPALLVQAWEKAEARSGWLGPAKAGGYLLFLNQLDQLETSRVVPGFLFSEWHSGRIGKLPKPEKAFGLSFQFRGDPGADHPRLGAFESASDLGQH